MLHVVDRLFSDATLAALYDPLCPRDQRADFDFYLPLIMSAKAVLDVGCGTGALLHEARALGHAGRLCGLDPAPGMLAQARTRPDIDWELGDLTSVAWTREFDLIVMTGHAFQVLVGDEELRGALTAVRAALTDDGRFAFETRNPLARAWEDWTPDNVTELVAPQGDVVRLVRRVTAPFDGRTVSFTHTFTGAAWDRPEVSHSTLRFVGAQELSTFLAQADFVIDDQFGDWDRQPLTDASPEIITIARAG